MGPGGQAIPPGYKLSKKGELKPIKDKGEKKDKKEKHDKKEKKDKKDKK